MRGDATTRAFCGAASGTLMMSMRKSDEFGSVLGSAAEQPASSALGRTGGQLMVHGDCSSRGCYAMTDEQIAEIYALGRESFFGGQRAFQLQAFPFKMTPINMAKHRNNPNFAFWKMLKEGYDNFEATKQPPQVAVCEQRYLFDQVDKDGQALSPRNARAACPVHKLDPQIADAVLEHRRDEQTKMANYIAEGVQIAASHVGDGGMNPVFADKLETQTQYDAKGQLVQIAVAPGALPKVPNPPGTTIPRAQVQPEQQPAETQPEQSQQPIALASVPKREAAPKPAEKVEAEAKPKATKKAAAAEAVAEPLVRGRGELVLVVDDDTTILDITRHTLENFGYRALVAEDGAQAIGLYALQRDEIAVVLTDMMMPVMDGAALVKALRRINPAVRIVATSGVQGNEAAAAEAGVKHFLAKPFTAADLLALLRRALG